MSNFDPIVYNAVKQINATGGGGGVREVGELMVVPVGFSDPDYVDTGTIFNPVTYPELASRFPTTTHISNFAEIPMPVVYAPTTTVNTTLPVVLFYVGPGQIIAADATRALRSDDNGATWTSLGTITAYNMGAYIGIPQPVYLNGYFYASVTMASSTTMIFRSTDLTSWTHCSTVAFNSNGIMQAGSMLALITAASGTTMWVSNDGVNWSSKTTASQALSAMAYNGSTYIVHNGSTTSAYTSTDGVTWTNRTLPVVATEIVGSPSGTFILRPSGAGSTVYSSTDGISWTSRATPVAIAATSKVFATATGVGFINVSSTSAYTTTDFSSWNTNTLPASTGASTVVVKGLGDTLFVYGGNICPMATNDGFATSSLGTFGVPAQTKQWNNIISSESVILATEANIPGVIYRSDDSGATWTPISLPSPTYVVQGLMYLKTSGLFVIINQTYANGYYTSPDGITWTLRTYPLLMSGPSVNWHDKNSSTHLVITGNVTGSAYNSYVSYDGINWSIHYVTSAALAAVKFKGQFVAVPTASASITLTTTLGLDGLGTASSYSVSQAASTVAPTITSVTAYKAVAASPTTIVILPTTTSAVSPNQGLYTVDGYYSSLMTMPFNALWSDVWWTGDFFVALPVQPAMNNPTSAVAVSYDGVSWDAYDMRSYVPANTPIRGIAVGSNEFGTYLSVKGHNSIFKLVKGPQVPKIPQPSPTTKYVVKAK